ncbi:Anti-sigma F factor antagonist (spoIIAA-2) [Candidatus Rhodobacter oscarellae]|uniref:Anti-sigma factor antagonist n=1 Tax=Candidatus Rhodobacter oscarellae TaxID=1675527 RepID=A0A0J9E7A0_9RHOB|nr:STAS domain-containing protein [Candidatus Rhodobacter lobularis]KMW58592.1 Anti-sigma F factor antagonist (spoIIAA-2) [Candidatus Rhodobacter lobularis]
MQMECQVYSDAVLILVNESRIDAAVAIQFKEKVRELATDGPERVVLDMSKVEFLDSSGLGALVAAMKHLDSGRSLELAALTTTVEKVFRLTRMETVFTIHKDARTAIAELARAS